MDYVLHYNIAAIVICLLVIVLFFSRKFFPVASNKYYAFMGVFVAFTSFCDILCSLSFMGEIKYNPVSFSLIFGGYFAGSILCALSFALYTMALVEDKMGSDAKSIKIIIAVLSVFAIITYPLSQITKMYFYMDNEGYHHGPFIWSFYGILAVGMAIVLYTLVRYGKFLTRRQRAAAYFALVIVILSIIFQAVFDKIPISNFANALVFMVVLHTLQNSRDYTNYKLSLFDDTAFYLQIDNYIRANKSFYVLCFDLEGVGFLEQTMGPEARTELLEHFGRECKENLDGMLFYLGGTRFAYIFDSTRREAIEKYAEWLNWRVMTPYRVKGIKVTLNIRIAVAEYGNEINDREIFINSLRYALREAKNKASQEIVWASDKMIESYQRYTDIVHVLKKQIVEKSFMVFYQPIYSAATRRFSAAEALIRLYDEKMGFVPPDEFIPIAESNGLIIEIGEIVFRKVCDFLSHEGSELGIDYIEVNLSMLQCMQEDLHKTLIEIMDEYGISYDKIDFEITETFSLTDQNVLIKNMNALISAGSSFAMDDYGTGFSNTEYLIKYPFKLVKLDKIFIWDAMKDDKAMKILEHTVAMIKSLDIQIVAEGVETKEQAGLLIDMGCDFLQGFLYSKPLQKELYIQFLKNDGNVNQ
jgi:EAL domain-containing protein (putative c-di-GMP-specific phosphodiesterase class I)/GGDEF domain-containing protein